MRNADGPRMSSLNLKIEAWSAKDPPKTNMLLSDQAEQAAIRSPDMNC